MRDRWSILRGLLTPWTRLVARRVIVGRQLVSDPGSGRFTQLDVDRVVGRAWVVFADLSTDLPGHPMVGSRLNVQLAYLTLAFFRALTEYGVARAGAIELTADLTWSFYGKWGVLQRFVERGDSQERIAVGDIVPLSFPFNPRGYPELLSPTLEPRLERENRHAFHSAPVRSSR